MSNLVIVIDAEIGAGKSTLLEVLRDLEQEKIAGIRRICIIPEPVELWKESGALDDFYNDVAGNAYKFQTYTYVTRVKKCLEFWEKMKIEKEKEKEKIEVDNGKDVYILERSIYSDKDIFVRMLHQDGLFSDLDYHMYLEWWDMWHRIMPFEPSAFVYLRTPLEECLRRIQARGRGKEVSIDRSYHEKLHQAHLAFMEDRRNNNFPVYELDGTINYKDNPSGKQEILKKVRNIINEML
jgi:deoxycitidine kinase